MVSDASAGIGRSIAETLGSKDARLMVHRRDRERPKKLAAEIMSAGSPQLPWIAQDFAQPCSAASIADNASMTLSSIDILVDNAGRSRFVNRDAFDAASRDGMTLSLGNHRRISRALLPQMIDHTSRPVISITGLVEPKELNAAAPAKEALTVWSKALEHQLGPHGITVNCIRPSLIESKQLAPMQHRSVARASRTRDVQVPR